MITPLNEEVPVDITVYLPDEIGQRAKEAELPLSRLLRASVEEELYRRATVAEAMKGATELEVDLEDEEGRPYTGRFAGVVLAEDRNATVYLADDERIMVYDDRKCAVHEIDNPEEELRDWLDDDAYVEAIHTLGLRPVVYL